MNNDAVIQELESIMNEFEIRFQALLLERKEILDHYCVELEQKQISKIRSQLQI